LQCGQSVPGGFDVCWNCGTSQDGTPDPNFNKVAAEEDPAAWKQAAAEQAATPGSEQQCRRCGSSKIIPNTPVLDQGQYSDGKLQVAVDGDPQAIIFKDRRYGRLLADICGSCGHVEFRVEHARELYEHFLRSKDAPEA
jgi:hypothetical protein